MYSSQLLSRFRERRTELWILSRAHLSCDLRATPSPPLAVAAVGLSVCVCVCVWLCVCVCVCGCVVVCVVSAITGTFGSLNTTNGLKNWPLIACSATGTINSKEICNFICQLTSTNTSHCSPQDLASHLRGSAGASMAEGGRGGRPTLPILPLVGPPMSPLAAN